MSWYDNEWGYSNRCVDLVRYISGKGLGSAEVAQAAGAGASGGEGRGRQERVVGEGT